jgi:preprotein translocase subunit YajC
VSILIPLAILFVLFWVFVALPQRRRQRAHVAMQDAISVGDEVITAGGLHGNVVEIADAVVRLEVAPGTVVRVDRRAVAARVEPTEPAETVAAADENPG